MSDLKISWAAVESTEYPDQVGYVIYERVLDSADPDDSSFDPDFDPATQGTEVAVLYPQYLGGDAYVSAQTYVILSGYDLSPGNYYSFKIAAWNPSVTYESPELLNWSSVLEVDT